MEKVRIKRTESLSFRLSLVIGLVIFFAVISATALVSWNSFNREINQQVSFLQGTAKIFSASIAKSVAAADEPQTKQALTAIRRFPTFKFASVERPDGSQFTELGFDVTLRAEEAELQSSDPRALLFKDDIWVEDTIVSAGQTVGKLKLLADISEIRSGFFLNLILNVASALVSAVLAILFSFYFVSALTNPVRKLSFLMNKLGRDATYSVRASEDGKGEIMLLAKSFNKMLADIEARDSQLLDYQTTLEDKVEDRTKSLMEAKNVAEKADAAKSEFLATMSHEIRTPMNGMLLMSELLATAQLTPKHQRYADVIMKSGKTLLAIINDILDFSKIQSGRMELEHIEVDVQRLAEDVMSLFWQKAEEKSLDLACFVEPGVPAKIQADPTRLNQVLSNLVNNALKFTESGSVTLHIKMVDDAEANTFIDFAVIDTGIGIKQENIAKVFESFSQADQSTTRKFGGTGLGLPICKHLVEAMDGALGVTSTFGQGSCFRFIIPAERTEAAGTVPKGTGKRALVLLDETPTTQMCCQALENSGMEVVIVPHDTSSNIDPAPFDIIIATGDTMRLLPEMKPEQTGVVLSKIGDMEIDDLIHQGKVEEVLTAPLSTFSVYEVLERILNGEPMGTRLLNASTYQAPELTSFAGKRILVTDDSAINREVIIQALTRYEITPTVVESGAAAIEAFNAGAFDLVFMDCSMPEMDGYEATLHLRKAEETLGRKPIPIIALTAHVIDQIAEKTKAVGMNDIVVKPFTIDTIGNCLAKWLGGSMSFELTRDSVPNDRAYAEPSAENSVFNETLLQNLREISGDAFEATLAQLHTLYAENAPAAFSLLEEACERGDTVEVSNTAHALKSMSYNIGAGKLGNACAAIERMAADPTQSKYKLENAFTSVAEAFNEVLANLQQSKDADAPAAETSPANNSAG